MQLCLRIMDRGDLTSWKKNGIWPRVGNTQVGSSGETCDKLCLSKRLPLGSSAGPYPSHQTRQRQSGAELCSQLRVLRATPRYSAPSPWSLVPSRDRNPLPPLLHPEPAKLACINFHFLCVFELSKHPNFYWDLGSSECSLPLRNDAIQGLKSWMVDPGRHVFK